VCPGKRPSLGERYEDFVGLMLGSGHRVAACVAVAPMAIRPRQINRGWAHQLVAEFIAPLGTGGLPANSRGLSPPASFRQRGRGEGAPATTGRNHG